VTTDATYRAQLSPRSIETLRSQGDLLTAAEVARLERDVDFDAIVALRRADERAKDPDARVPLLPTWRASLERHFSTR
jgi:gamma-butyrobetaine dioxygenase